MIDAAPTKIFQFVGGALCLDFCNTVGGCRENIPRENLHSIANFISWSEQAGLFNPRQVGALNRQAPPADADAVFKRAIELREAIYRIFFTASCGGSPRKQDLSVLNSELAHSLGRLQVQPRTGEQGFQWRWADGEARLENPLGPIARSAAELLTSEAGLGRVRHCHGENCGWLFLDGSKNHSRRWCDMSDCGNRAKVRRHRLKDRKDRAS